MRYLMLFSFVAVFFLNSCDYFQSSEDEFIEAYKEILIIRETMKADSLKQKADKKVEQIYDEYGYTEESFRDEFFELAKQNTRRFYELLDTLRNNVKEDLKNLDKKSEEDDDNESNEDSVE